MTNTLTYKDITDYENLLIRFYHSYLTSNYLAELLSITLRHLPEDTPIDTLADLANEYETVASLAVDAASTWSEIFFDMTEGGDPADPDLLSIIPMYHHAKKEMQENIGRVWLRVSELFDVAQHDAVIRELEASIASQSIEEQYDLVLTGQYPTMPENIQDVIASLKANAMAQTSVASAE